MSLASNRPINALESLSPGQRLSQAEFHDRYEAMPPGTSFELINGKVFMASPVGPRHGKQTFHLSGWLFQYVLATPGVDGLDNTSVALNDHNEVQPDLLLRIEFDRGGRSRNLGGIIAGAPELVVEVADSSRATDLGPKRSSYEQGNCLEYLVFTLTPPDILWHIRHDDKLTPVVPDADGILRSRAFPGLWLNSQALIANDLPALIETLNRGLATPEHAALVARLAAASPRGDHS